MNDEMNRNMSDEKSLSMGITNNSKAACLRNLGTRTLT